MTPFRLYAGKEKAKVIRYYTQVLSKCKSEGCHVCKETLSPTRFYCRDCNGFLCKDCLQMDLLPFVPVVRCLDCRVAAASKGQWLKDPKLKKRLRKLAQAELRMENQSLRASSVLNVKRGCMDYIKFADLHRLPEIPESQEEVAMYVAYSLHDRVPATLDSSTLTSYVGNVNTFLNGLRVALGVKIFNPIRGLHVRRLMKVARDDYKKESKAKVPWTIKEFKRMLKHGFANTRTGRHQRMCLILHTLGVLRPKAGANMRIKFTRTGQHITYHKSSAFKVNNIDGIKHLDLIVRKDKNVKSYKIRESYIPSYIKEMGIYPVAEFETYLRESGIQSGNYFLAAPLGGERSRSFRTNPYTNHSKAFKKAYLRAHPNATKDDVEHMGGQSCRKSLAQWLWDDGWDKRVIADSGGWALQRDAVDVYFRTGRTKLLWAMRNIGRKHRKMRANLRDAQG